MAATVTVEFGTINQLSSLKENSEACLRIFGQILNCDILV